MLEKRDNEAICDSNLHGLTVVRSIRSEISPGATKAVEKKENDEKRDVLLNYQERKKKKKVH